MKYGILRKMNTFFGRFLVQNPFGKSGEDIATQFLRDIGFSIIARNVVNSVGRRLGEIDIIARDGHCLVFVEVKTRSACDIPFSLSIQKDKLRRLAKIAEWYMKQSNFVDQSYRFDMVGVVVKDGMKPNITHIQDIFL